MVTGSGSHRGLTLLPKAHLHVHLESTVRWSTLRELGEANGVPVPPRPGPGGLRFDGFRAFGDHNALVRACLRRAEDFERVAREFCADEAADGTRYAEVTFTAASHGERLGDADMPLAAVCRGLAEGGGAHGIETRVLLDHSRRRSVDRFDRTFALAKRFAAGGVVGIGLAGDEAYPLAPFAEVLTRARAAGVALVHHAGEAGGPASIAEAIDVGLADRLGHGFRVLEDAALVARVRAAAIPLEVCPSSNVALGLIGSFAEHPLPTLVEAGLAVTLNTDVPAIVGVTLAGEYGRVRAAFGYDDAALAGLARAGVAASFAPPELKARLAREIDTWLAT